MTTTGIEPKTMREALRRIRKAEMDARRALEHIDDMACYAALERCQHAAFDAKALFLGSELPEEEER